MSKSVDILMLSYNQYYPNERPTSYDKVIDVMNNIVFNCCRAKRTKDRKLKFVLRKEFYSTHIVVGGKGCKNPLSYAIFKRVIDVLVKEGYLDIEVGGKIKYKILINTNGEHKIRDGYTPSFMTPTEDMLDLIKEMDVKKDFLNYNMLVLRDEEKKDLPFVLTQVLRKQKKLLLAYNESIELSIFKDKNGSIIEDPLLRRIYTKDFSHGGRFYVDQGKIQTMHQQDRRLITINDEACCEIDVCYMHPTIAYTEVGEKLDKDPYDYKIECDIDTFAIDKFKKKHKFDDYDPIRNLKKLIMLIAFNCESDRLSFAICDKLAQDKYKQVSKVEDINKESLFVGLSDVKVNNAIANMKEHNCEIIHVFGDDRSCFQFKDSLFMHNLLNYCLQEHIVVVPVHDSVICPISKKDIVEKFMRKAFADTFGSDMNLKVKIK